MIHKKMWLQLVYFAFILNSCCSSKQPYIQLYHSTIDKKISQICKEEEVKIIGSGGRMMDGIEQIILSISASRRVSLVEAREMAVRFVEELTETLNAAQNLQPFLKPYPFPASKIDLSILFLKSDGSFVDYGCAYLGKGGVSDVQQIDGVLFYSSFNPRTGLLEDYYEESYETALAIVRGELEDTVCEPVPSRR